MHDRSARWYARVSTIGMLCLGCVALMPVQTTEGRQSTQRSAQVRSSTPASPPAGRYRSTGRYRGRPPATAQPTPRYPVRPPYNALYLSQQLGTTEPSGYVQGGAAPVVPAPLYHGGHRLHPHSVVYLPGQVSAPVAPPAPVVQVVQAAPPEPQPIYIVLPPTESVTGQAPPASAPGSAVPVNPSATTPSGTIGVAPVPQGPGRVRLTIAPSTAQIHLDDRLLGTGASVGLQGPLTLPAGVHILEVSHPEHPSERVVFGVSAGGSQEIVIDLEASKPSRRSRVVALP